MITDIKVQDNFYTDPDSIVNASNGEFPIFGCGTGNRSVGLQEVDQNLFHIFCQRLFRLHSIADNRNLQVFTFFMEHYYNPEEIFNRGWVHIDGKNPDACRMTTEEYKLLVCGQVFLTPDPDPNSGVEIHKLKNGINWDQQELFDRCINDYTIPREEYQAGRIDLAEYTRLHGEYHSNFELTAEVKNCYNRMVSWKAGTLHTQHMTAAMPTRLNQYFFVSRR